MKTSSKRICDVFENVIEWEMGECKYMASWNGDVGTDTHTHTHTQNEVFTKVFVKDIPMFSILIAIPTEIYIEFFSVGNVYVPRFRANVLSSHTRRKKFHIVCKLPLDRHFVNNVCCTGKTLNSVMEFWRKFQFGINNNSFWYRRHLNKTIVLFQSFRPRTRNSCNFSFNLSIHFQFCQTHIHLGWGRACAYFLIFLAEG